jgi:hypothetical protein
MDKNEKIFFKTILSILNTHRKDNIKRDKDAHEQDKYVFERRTKDVKHYAGEYKAKMDAIKFANSYPNLPEEFKKYSETIKQQVDQIKVDLVSIAYEKKLYAQRIKEYQNRTIINPIATRPLIKEEFERVQGFIQDGIVESIEYDPANGIKIVYPGRLVGDDSNPNEKLKTHWTGRIQVTIHDKTIKHTDRTNCSILNFKSLSYSLRVSTAFTWHCYFEPTYKCGNFCLGSFKKLIEEAVSNRLLSQLILLIDAYMSSSSRATRFTSGIANKLIATPDLKTIDGSWDDFKKTEEYQIWLKEYKKNPTQENRNEEIPF